MKPSQTARGPSRRPGMKGVLDASIGTVRQILSLVVVLAVTMGVTAGFLLLVRMFWHVYVSSPVGQRFVVMFAEDAEVIGEVISMEISRLSIELSLTAFVIIFIVGTACRLLHVMRHLYAPFGWVLKLALWGLPATALVAVGVQNRLDVAAWEVACFFALVPTLCILFKCFGILDRLVPEIGDILRWVKG